MRTFVISLLLVPALTAHAGQSSLSKRVVPTGPPIQSALVSDDRSTPPASTERGGGAVLIGTTTYDYGWNDGTPSYVYHYNGLTYMIYMNRFGAANEFREVAYRVYDGFTFSALQPVIPSSQVAVTGFPSIDVWRGGLADGFAGVGVSVVSGSFYSLESAPGQGNFISSSASPFYDVNILHVDSNGTVLMFDSRARERLHVQRSTDFGNTFNVVNPAVDSTTALPGGQSMNTLDTPTFLWPNGDVGVGATLQSVFGFQSGGHLPPVGTGVPASVNLFGYFRSTNQGSTWTWNTIVLSGQELFPNFFYIPINFSQFDMLVDNTGKLRTAFNGFSQYQYAPHPDSLRSSIDVVYWDEVNGFKSLVSFDRTLPIIEQQVLNFFPGNALGACYPSIATSPDGQVVVVTWSQPGFTATTIDTLHGFLLHDIWYNASFDGGATWGGATRLTNTNDRTELFTVLAPALQPIPGGGYKAHLTYFSDANNGCSLFGEGPIAVEEWYYHPFYVMITSVENPGVVSEFALHQNYPNPFNPATRISYSLAQGADVTLSVSNILGQEVALVREGYKSAGTHAVEFQASQLPSGVYFYTLRAGPFVETRKMVVMK